MWSAKSVENFEQCPVGQHKPFRQYPVEQCNHPDSISWDSIPFSGQCNSRGKYPVGQCNVEQRAIRQNKPNGQYTVGQYPAGQ